MRIVKVQWKSVLAFGAGVLSGAVAASLLDDVLFPPRKPMSFGNFKLGGK